MTVYVRRDPCYVCNKPVKWNDKTNELSCGCGDFPARFVNLREFKPVKELIVHGREITNIAEVKEQTIVQQDEFSHEFVIGDLRHRLLRIANIYADWNMFRLSAEQALLTIQEIVNVEIQLVNTHARVEA